MRSVDFHASGCIHRDIKPLNLMFSSQTRDADLLLTDFGVAMILDCEFGHDRDWGTCGYTLVYATRTA